MNYLDQWKLLECNLVSRHVYNKVVPRAIHYCHPWNETVQGIKKLLNLTPKNIDAKIIDCFEMCGPMTVRMFDRVAKVYGLHAPMFDNSVKLRKKQGLYGEVTEGMFSS